MNPYSTRRPCAFGEPPCGVTPTRPYPEGARCAAHTPSARAGQPEPDVARYCPPAVCYCGQCGVARTVTPIRDTVIDTDAVRSGKRRASVTVLRDARAQPRRRT